MKAFNLKRWCRNTKTLQISSEKRNISFQPTQANKTFTALKNIIQTPNSIPCWSGSGIKFGGIQSDSLRLSLSEHPQIYPNMTGFLRPSSKEFTRPASRLRLAGGSRAAQRWDGFNTRFDKALSNLLSYPLHDTLSRLHGDYIRGQLAAEKLIELEPENSSTYVLLS